MCDKNRFTRSQLHRAYKNLRYLRSIPDIDTARVVELSQDLWALVLIPPIELDGLLLAAFSSQNALFRFGLQQGSSAAKLFMNDSVIIWLDSVQGDDRVAMCQRAHAAFSWFSSNDDDCVHGYSSCKGIVQIENDSYKYVALS